MTESVTRKLALGETLKGRHIFQKARDLYTGPAVVLSRAATTLQSVET